MNQTCTPWILSSSSTRSYTRHCTWGGTSIQERGEWMVWVSESVEQMNPVVFVLGFILVTSIVSGFMTLLISAMGNLVSRLFWYSLPRWIHTRWDQHVHDKKEEQQIQVLRSAKGIEEEKPHLKFMVEEGNLTSEEEEEEEKEEGTKDSVRTR